MESQETRPVSIAGQCDYEVWKQTDFSIILREMENKVNQLIKSRQELAVSRSELIKNCELYMKTTPETIKQYSADLIKNFQSEIDALTKHCAETEIAFIQQCSILSRLRDTQLALKAGSQRNISNQTETGKVDQSSQLETTYANSQKESLLEDVRRELVLLKDNCIAEIKKAVGLKVTSDVPETNKSQKSDEESPKVQAGASIAVDRASQCNAKVCNSTKNLESETSTWLEGIIGNCSEATGEGKSLPGDVCDKNCKNARIISKALKIITIQLAKGNIASIDAPDIIPFMAALANFVSSELAGQLQPCEGNTSISDHQRSQPLCCSNSGHSSRKESASDKLDLESSQHGTNTESESIQTGSLPESAIAEDSKLLIKKRRLCSAVDDSKSTDGTLYDFPARRVRRNHHDDITEERIRHIYVNELRKCAPSEFFPGDLQKCDDNERGLKIPDGSVVDFSSVGDSNFRSALSEKLYSILGQPLAMNFQNEVTTDCVGPEFTRLNENPNLGGQGNQHASQCSGQVKEEARSESPWSSPETTASNQEADYFMRPSVVCTDLGRPLLQPISKDLFDKYVYLDTAELMGRAKGFLSQCSVSQKLFGQEVVGVSQGSMSDLLAHPKPWETLTQKGREPYIRVAAFLDDKEAVVRLLHTRDESRDMAIRQNRLRMASCRRSEAYNLLKNFSYGNLSETNLKGLESCVYGNAMDKEMSKVFFTDTKAITKRVREALDETGISQKVFGEAVLKAPVAFTKDLLSEPKPWSHLSLEDKEAVLRMYIWLQDPKRVEKLVQHTADQYLKRISQSDPIADLNVSKKRSHVITSQQKIRLNEVFKETQYPKKTLIKELSREIGLPCNTVTNWFQNRRMRDKRQ